MGDSVEVIVARIDERTKGIKGDIVEIKTEFKAFRSNCSTQRSKINKRIDKLNPRLSGRDKAIVYAALVTALSSLVGLIISTR